MIPLGMFVPLYGNTDLRKTNGKKRAFLPKE